MSKQAAEPWPIEHNNSDNRGGGQWYDVGPARVWFSYSATEEERKEALAAAKLISVAPVMLAALKMLMPLMDMAFEADGDVFGDEHNNVVNAIHMAADAIAEVGGDQ